MAGHKQDFHPVVVIFEVLLWNERHINFGTLLRNRINFNTLLQVVSDGYDLRVVVLDRYLLNFPLAE